MSNNFEEVYYVLEESLELAFKGQFVVKLYEYFQSRGVTKLEADQFLNSSTAHEIASVVTELTEYIKGGMDSDHKQLREAYHHIPKPQARKIRDYLACILEDAVQYSNDKRRGRKRRSK
jgi:transcriptional regulatory protein LevR|tara:strand:- start:256 stop:612 length:357 start_codon:yes stop_codon:yes gene_type:complete